LQHDNVCDGDDLLRCRLEIPCLLRLASEILDGVHQLFGLINECLAEVNRPCQVLVHFSDQFRELRDRLDVIVPGLLIHLGDIVRVSDEARSLNHLQRISGGRQDDGDKRIRVEGDWFGQFLELCRALFGWC
jgi:hypothetical protein